MNAAIWWRFIDQSLQIAFIDPREVQLSCDVALRRQRGTRLLKKFDSSRGNVTVLWFWFRSEPETSCFGDVALRKPVWSLYSEFALLKIQLDYGKADMAVEASICHSKADLTVENQIWQMSTQMTCDFWKSKLVIAHRSTLAIGIRLRLLDTQYVSWRAHLTVGYPGWPMRMQMEYWSVV